MRQTVTAVMRTGTKDVAGLRRTAQFSYTPLDSVHRATKIRQEVAAVPSKNILFSKQSLGVVTTAIAVGVGLLVGFAGSGRAQDAAQQPQYKWASQDEYNDAKAVMDEKDAAKKVAALDKWKKDFPQTDPKVLELRQSLFLNAYQAAGQFRQEFDLAEEMLKTNPTDLQALGAVVQSVMGIKPAPTAADLDGGEKAANTIINDPAVFAKKPDGVTDAQWTQTQAQVKTFAEQVLVSIIMARKNDKRAVDDLTKLLQKDPSMAIASYQLGTSEMNVIKADKKPEDQPLAFWNFARAAAYDGPNSLPAAQRKQIQDFLTGAYKTYHGSTDGLNDLLAAAKAGAMIPANFHIDSTVDIAKRQQEEEDKRRAADPLGQLWAMDVKGNLLGPNGDMVWENNIKDAELPPPDAAGMPQYFKAKIVSMEPETKPKELTVSIGGTPDAKLKFENALPGKMEAGEEIQFKGQAKEWTKEPFMITFDVDAKEGLKGWTGKNAAPARSGTKGGTKAAPKAPPKQ